MFLSSFRIVFFLLTLSLFSACANMIPPSGGKSDVTPPKLLRIKPKDSLLNTRVTRIEMKFDEYITVSDVSKEVHISPALSQSPTLAVSGKSVIVKIQDSLLQEQTTYTINFGKAIKDLREGNPYTAKSFLFSTGAWFDSLKIKGYIVDAEAGKQDSSGATKVLLYDANLPFDVVTKQKPAYVSNVKSDGKFTIEGLPNRRFRIFALKETGDDLKFNDDNELIGFADTTYNPAIDTTPISLHIFKEIPDTTRVIKEETASDSKFNRNSSLGNTSPTNSAPALDAKTFNYVVDIDTANREKRTQEITKPIQVFLSRKVQSLNEQRIFLSADSAGIELEQTFKANLDSSKMKFTLTSEWLPNTLYTLRLLKSFAQDSSAIDAMPSKYIFRTKSEEDYGKMEINIPEKYVGKPYLLAVNRDTDSVYLNPITNPKVLLQLLPAGTYKLTIIEDKNSDGEWTTGELKTRRHAEQVIPFPNTVLMKMGWEHVVDFEPKKK